MAPLKLDLHFVATSRGASDTCQDNLLPLDGGGLSLPAIASLSSLRRCRPSEEDLRDVAEKVKGILRIRGSKKITL